MWNHYAEFWFMGAWGLVLALTRRCVFGRLCREAALGSGSKGKMLRQMTLKFEKSRELRVEIQDVSVFVRKYLYQEKRFGVRLAAWKGLPERWTHLILCAGIAEALVLYFSGADPLACTDRAMAAALATAAVRAAALIFESESLWVRAENSLTDYAANTLYPRQHHEYEDFRQETQEEAAAPLPAEGKAPGQERREPGQGLVLETEEKKLFQEVLSELLSG